MIKPAGIHSRLGMRSVIRKYGRDTARRLFQSSLDAIDFVETVIRDENIECGFARSGHFFAAGKPGHYGALVADAEFIAGEFDHPTRLVPQSEQRSEVGTDAYYGGLVDEVSARLNPAQYVIGLAPAAQKAGATLHARAPHVHWTSWRALCP